MKLFGERGGFVALITRVLAAFVIMTAVSACTSARHGSKIVPTTFSHATPVLKGKRAPDWKPHFKDVSKGAIRIDLSERKLTYWAPGGEKARVFKIAVPRDPSLQRTGRTRVVRKKVGPDWRPTPSMIERDPRLPKYVGPGPGNPLGEYAMYLGWRYYAVHGTNSQASIGRRATSGCFRLAKHDIEWLFKQTKVGTPVLVQGKVSGPFAALPN